MITVSEIRGTEQDGLWDRYVLERQQATGYHLIAWRRVVSNAFGHKTHYYIAQEPSGIVCGVLPLIYIHSPLFGRFLVSLPYFNYGGLVSDHSEATEALLSAAKACATSKGAAHIELRHMAGHDLPWLKKDHKVSMRLDLPSRYEELMKAFSPKLRAQVRRGEKEGMTAEVGGVSLLDDFYLVFSRNMRELGTPVYGKSFFTEILNTFQKDARICIVYFNARAVAAGFVYGFRNTLEIPWAASDRRYARMAPNMMLYGSVLRYACEQGYRVFDFGRSSKDSGTYRFKEQWGAKPVQLHWYYWLHGGDRLPELNPQNPKYRLAIEIWKRLPLPIANWLGPQVSKYLP